jgi:hypothetical protein
MKKKRRYPTKKKHRYPRKLSMAEEIANYVAPLARRGHWPTYSSIYEVAGIFPWIAKSRENVRQVVLEYDRECRGHPPLCVVILEEGDELTEPVRLLLIERGYMKEGDNPLRARAVARRRWLKESTEGLMGLCLDEQVEAYP